MNQVERNKTDEAWKRLYNRFSEDDLLPKSAPTKTIHMSSYRWISAAASILLLIGLTIIWRNNNESSVPLIAESNLESNTLVTTLSDGSVVYLSKDATIEYPEVFEEKKREVILEGSAFFDIEHDKNHPFVIETKNVSVEVLGTSFNVENTLAGVFSLSVKTGKVKVTDHKSHKYLIVSAGQTITLENNKLTIKDNEEKDLFNRYTEDIRFKDETLGNILNVLNRNHSTQIISTTEALGKRRLTVAFNNETPEEMAYLISVAMNLKLQNNPTELILTEK